MSDWKSRIVERAMVDPKTLTKNTLNWRRHPAIQAEAMKEALDRVGWVQDIIVNQRSGLLVDGHLRLDLAIAHDEREIPVVYVDLDSDEERLVLATYDPLGALATTDRVLLDGILQEVEAGAGALAEMLARLAQEPAIESGGAPDKMTRDTDAPTLVDRFVVPPFSVLDARQGYWQERKRAWLSLGIQSEIGRISNVQRDSLQKKIERDEMNLSERGAFSPPKGDYAYPVEMLQQASGASIFDPVLTEIAYRWFCPLDGVILDPFAGGSVRGIVAGLLDRHYVGVDLRQEQIDANVAQRATIAPVADISWIAGDSRDVATLAPGQYDFLFSCPPYADLEVYSDDPRDLSTMDYHAFCRAYRDVIAASCALLREDRFACFVVGEVRDKRGIYRGLVAETKSAFEASGLLFYNDAVLVTAVGSLSIRSSMQFSAGRKLGKTHQNVLVFVKGDWRKAVEAVGPVEVGDVADAYGEVVNGAS
jgi:hypothetical protein